ncbi:hypothetical protein FRUB_05224 [Fimbriiglobus ruber]|uniref:Uncharacterized protein n=1 Tax=Fimbriiglobus ruber TaxID=1908690 RepID=A0A225DVC9_9BACT|nr:hypothetical protein FRUB_05224 [Fimbriiglobus ruber]
MTPAEAFASGAEHAEEPPALIRPTGLARIVVGCVVALGLFVGLREWVHAALAAVLSGSDGEQSIAYLAPGAFLTVLLRMVGVVVGGLMSGAGRSRGWATGACTGVLCIGLFAVLDAANEAPPGVGAGVAAAVAILLATVAGWVGGRTWPAPAELPEPPDPSQRSSLARLVEREEKASGPRPTLWFRLLIGTVIACAGFAGADAIRIGMKRAAPGMLNFGGAAHAAATDAEIALLLVVAGGVLVGSSTGAGLRHGLISGFLTGLACIASSFVQQDVTAQTTSGVAELFGVSQAQASPGLTAVVVCTAVFVATAFGGWLGGQLFPPVVPVHLRKRRKLFD